MRRVGPYGKLLANYASDDAIIAAGEAAELLFCRAVAWLSTSDSDGYITDAQLIRYVGAGMKDAKKRASVLVREGLWVREDDGYQVRSWVKINETAEEKGRKRRTDRERKRSQPPEGVPEDSARNPEGIPEESETGTARNRPNRLPVTLVGNDGSPVQSIDAAETEPAARKPRSRDELFEAVIAVCGIDGSSLTETGRGALNKALKQLREIEASPGQVKVRAGRYRQAFPKASLTPSALAKHWAQLSQSGQQQDRPTGWEFGQ